MKPVKFTEDDCYVCGDGGELIECSFPSCPKVYHLACVHLTQPPRGKWLCPHHRCDECDVWSVVRCRTCISSWCGSHKSDRINSQGQCAECVRQNIPVDWIPPPDRNLPDEEPSDNGSSKQPQSQPTKKSRRSANKRKSASSSNDPSAVTAETENVTTATVPPTEAIDGKSGK
eukprot:c10287_g1_i1.p1 GENE.c10287_g1_i1~~c10287_g1_i1.p1  ORF type:complete len:173 (+),score=36.67 c10287_g1_i1:938-1456(+)